MAHEQVRRERDTTGDAGGPPRRRSAVTGSVAQVLALQRAAGNRAVQRLLVPRARASVATIARAPHRPGKGAQIEWNGGVWTVDVSEVDNPMVTVSKPKQRGGKDQRTISWADEDFWIVRPNNDKDFDMRERVPNVQAPHVREQFRLARERALAMIKDYAKPYVQKSAENELARLTLNDFVATKQALSPLSNAQEDTEWKLEWKEGANKDRPRRTWKFTIDSDDPPPDSDQEPHVGWDAQATEGFERGSAIARKFGHIWLSSVPVSRGGF